METTEKEEIKKVIREVFSEEGGAILGLANILPGTIRSRHLGGESWYPYDPEWSCETTAPSIGNGSLIGRYILYGKLCYFKVKLVAGSTTTFGTGDWIFSLPVPASSVDYIPMYGKTYVYDTSEDYYALSVWVFIHSVNTYRTTVEHNVPFIWTTGDECHSIGAFDAA